MTTPQLIDLVIQCSINSLMALGLSIQMRSGQLSAASGALAGVGALVAVKLTIANQPIALCLLGGGFASAVIGALLSAPLVRLRGFYLAVATLAFAELMRVVAQNIEWMGGATGLQNIQIRTSLFSVLLVLVIVMIGTVLLSRSIFGLRLENAQDSESALQVLGINTDAHRTIAFTIGASILGIGGAFHAHYVGFLPPEFYGVERGVEVLLFVSLAGIRYPLLAIAAASMVTILVESLRAAGEDRYLVYGGMLILISILRLRGPQLIHWTRTKLS